MVIFMAMLNNQMGTTTKIVMIMIRTSRFFFSEMTIVEEYSIWSKLPFYISHQWYPLVNIEKTMDNHHAINGKTHYFYGHFQ